MRKCLLVLSFIPISLLILLYIKEKKLFRSSVSEICLNIPDWSQAPRCFSSCWSWTWAETWHDRPYEPTNVNPWLSYYNSLSNLKLCLEIFILAANKNSYTSSILAFYLTFGELFHRLTMLITSYTIMF